MPSGSSTRPGPASRVPGSPGRPESGRPAVSSAAGIEAAARRLPPLPELTQLALIGLLVVLAAVAWAISSEQMAGMDAGPGTDPGTLGFFVALWVVMMAAMMFPSIGPMVLMHVRIQGGQRRRGRAIGATACFVAGYLVAWAAAGLVGYALFRLGKAATGDAFAWENAGPYLAGGIVVAAAGYQLTPLKDTCLRHCRSPLAFLISHWQPGRLGGFRMGLAHGGWCIGCCWALMAALFALGVMSLGWMALIGALIAAEKLLPWKGTASAGIAALLLVLGLALALAPARVPGLVVPGTPAAMRSMDRMDGSMGGDSMGGGSMGGDSMQPGRAPMPMPGKQR